MRIIDGTPRVQDKRACSSSRIRNGSRSDIRNKRLLSRRWRKPAIYRTLENPSLIRCFLALIIVAVALFFLGPYTYEVFIQEVRAP